MDECGSGPAAQLGCGGPCARRPRLAPPGGAPAHRRAPAACGARLARRARAHVALARGPAGVLAAAAAWFPDNGFATPSLYVPTAWMLGALRSDDLAWAPFPMIETLRGVRQPRRRRFDALPLVGFEADTGLCAAGLGWANVTAPWGGRRKGWLRIALHPYDQRLRSAPAIEPWLRAIPEAASYAALRERGATPGPAHAEREETRPWHPNTGFSSSSPPR